ncbi:hypothetical protein LCGC14_1454740 [marine sediment metagenome]|uniref:Uncharacterized protein n=1 Tax=marine sediment metagenome TaxID=412755 RepID=A0A0F9JGR4_9ZZZZ
MKEKNSNLLTPLFGIFVGFWVVITGIVIIPLLFDKGFIVIVSYAIGTIIFAIYIVYVSMREILENKK